MSPDFGGLVTQDGVTAMRWTGKRVRFRKLAALP
jgi:hypothetical protein